MAEDAGRAVGPSGRGTRRTSARIPSLASAAGQDELVQYLRTGRVAGKVQAGGMMAEAVENSFQHMPETDLRAIAAYLKAPRRSAPSPRRTASARPGPPMTRAARPASAGAAWCRHRQPEVRRRAVQRLLRQLSPVQRRGQRQPGLSLAVPQHGHRRGHGGQSGRDHPVRHRPQCRRSARADAALRSEVLRQSADQPAGGGHFQLRAGELRQSGSAGHARGRAGDPAMAGEAQPYLVPGGVAVLVVLLLLLLAWRRVCRRRSR